MISCHFERRNLGAIVSSDPHQACTKCLVLISLFLRRHALGLQCIRKVFTALYFIHTLWWKLISKWNKLFISFKIKHRLSNYRHTLIGGLDGNIACFRLLMEGERALASLDSPFSACWWCWSEFPNAR